MSRPVSRSLLLACTRRTLRPDEKNAVAALTQQPIDWHDLLKGAAWHGVASLIAAHLRDMDSVPDWVRQHLDRLERVNAFRSLRAAKHVRATLLVLQKHGIEAIAWKGPALAFEAYGDVTKRTSNDVDILVRPSQLQAARKALLDSGYSLEGRAQRRSEGQTSMIEELSGEIQLFGPDGSYLLELHKQFLPATNEDPAVLNAMWERSHSAKAWDGQPILRLAVPDLLLTLCTHGTKHGWSRLKWAADIAALLEARRAEIDWPNLLEHAQACGLLGELLLGVGLAQRYLAAPVPQHVAAKIRASSAISKTIERQETIYATDTAPVNGVVHALRVRLACQPFAKRCKTALKELLTASYADIQDFKGNDKWLWLAPVLRPFRLCRKYLKNSLENSAACRPVRWYTKWCSLQQTDKRFLLQAAVTLAVVRAGLSIFDFKRVLTIAQRFSAPGLLFFNASAPTPDQCSRLIPMAARLVPQATCLTQAIAGRWLLACGAEGLEIQLGVSKRGGTFAAHAILLHHGQVLLGGKASQQIYEPIFSTCA